MFRLVAAVAALLAAAPASADRALLIGVGRYPLLPEALRLAAPEEDARRLAAALTAAGFPRERLEVMTADTSTPPTRAAVLAALDRLADTVAAGEQVLIYYSGHGTQAPTATPALEPDGLDELYLMLDARGWDGRAGQVPGAVLDKEIASRIAAIRARGADVWFVADTCHAGGMFRGAADARTKAVAPQELGIPSRSAGSRPMADIATVGRAPAAGRLASFFAAGPGALAVERRLPLGSSDARPLSQFSYALARAIAAGRLRSLRDLAVAIEAVDAGVGGDRPAPIFEGALDMSVLGLTPDRPRRYPLARVGAALSMAAGVEEGFAPGDRVTLLSGDRVLGSAIVDTVGLAAARIAAPADLPPGAIEAEHTLSASGDPRGHPLLRAIAPLAARGAAEALDVTAALWRPGTARTCPTLASGTPPGARRVETLALPPLHHCDVLILTVTNTGSVAVDVSPIYFEAGGKVSGLGYLGGASARIDPDAQRQIAVRALTRDASGEPLAIGVERVALVALPALTRSPRDLRGALVGAAWRGGEDASLDSGAGALTYAWRVER